MELERYCGQWHDNYMLIRLFSLVWSQEYKYDDDDTLGWKGLEQ